jgi:hypothetical protein
MDSMAKEVDGTMLDLPLAQLKAFEDEMKSQSIAGCWDVLLDIAQKNDTVTKWRMLFLTVIHPVTAALESTDMQDRVIATPAFKDVESIVQSLSDEEVDEWKKLVKRGVKDGHWTGLVMHRVYQSAIDHPVVLKFYRSQA